MEVNVSKTFLVYIFMLEKWETNRENKYKYID